VDPDYHDANLKTRHEGEVEFQAVVGTDGGLREPRVRGSLSEAHEAQVLRALRLWRYEPARRKDGPLAARISGRLVLRIYR
jgi:TonB family protein